MSLHTRFSLPAVVVALVLTAAPASAAPSAPAAPPLFGNYWREFVDHWGGKLKQQNGVVMVALGVGAVSLFILTRGKWMK